MLLYNALVKKRTDNIRIGFSVVSAWLLGGRRRNQTIYHPQGWRPSVMTSLIDEIYQRSAVDVQHYVQHTGSDL